MVRTVADRRLVRELALGVDDFVRAVIQKELLVNVALRAGHDVLRAELLQQRGRLERALEIIPDRDQDQIEITHADRGEKALPRGVSDHGVRDEGQDVIDPLLPRIDGHHVLSQLLKLPGRPGTESPQADHQD